MISSRPFRWRSIMRWLTLILWILLIAFLMLSPGKHSTADDVSNFFGGTEFSDWCGHVILFGPLALLTYRVTSLYRPLPTSLILTLILVMLYGALTEILQQFVPDRGASLIDMLGNWCGALAFALILR